MAKQATALRQKSSVAIALDVIPKRKTVPVDQGALTPDGLIPGLYTPDAITYPGYNFISPLDAYQQVLAGVSVERIDSVARQLGVTKKELADMLGIAESTLHKWLKDVPTINDRSIAQQLVLLAMLAKHGQLIFPKPGGFQQWLRSPQWDLGDKKPIEYLNVNQGIVYVDQILGRIEHGLPL